MTYACDDEQAGTPDHNKRIDDDRVTGRIDSVRDSGWEDNGYHLQLDLDEIECDLRVTDTEVARALIAAVDGLRGWVAEHDYERAAYERATPEERAQVLFGQTDTQLLEDIEVAIEVDDEALREAADHQRKYRREHPDA